MLKCSNCAYYWQERGEEHPSCHYEGPDKWAPCEYEEPDDCDYEVGFDPYAGCYTDDC